MRRKPLLKPRWPLTWGLSLKRERMAKSSPHMEKTAGFGLDSFDGEMDAPGQENFRHFF